MNTQSVVPQKAVYSFTFEGYPNPFHTDHEFVTPPDIRRIVGIAGSTDPLVIENPDGTERQLREDEKVDLAKAPRIGRSPRFKRGFDRKGDELRLVSIRFPAMRQNDGWVEIPDYPLPVGLYNMDKTVLAFLIPLEYPTNPPDNFYVTPGLKFKSGAALTNYSESGGPRGGQWGVFSFHPESWKATADLQTGDSLHTFLRVVNLRLQEGN